LVSWQRGQLATKQLKLGSTRLGFARTLFQAPRLPPKSDVLLCRQSLMLWRHFHVLDPKLGKK
jgi:hypothetical protein